MDVVGVGADDSAGAVSDGHDGAKGIGERVVGRPALAEAQNLVNSLGVGENADRCALLFIRASYSR